MNAVGYELQAHSWVIGTGTGEDTGRLETAPILKLVAENLDTFAGDRWVLVTLPGSAVAAREHQVLPKERVIIGIEDGPSDEQVKIGRAHV